MSMLSWVATFFFAVTIAADVSKNARGWGLIAFVAIMMAANFVDAVCHSIKGRSQKS
jgi:hypothetical protein